MSPGLFISIIISRPGAQKEVVVPQQASFNFTWFRAWFSLVPTWLHRSKQYVLLWFRPGSTWFRPGSMAPNSLFYNDHAPTQSRLAGLLGSGIGRRWRRRGDPGRRLLRNLGRVCGTSVTTSTHTLMRRASAKVCPAAPKTWGAMPKALPCFFWECKILLHMPCPGMPRRGAVGICGE